MSHRPVRVLYICSGLNDLSGTATHMRNILKFLSPAIEAHCIVGTKIPQALEAHFSGIREKVTIIPHYKRLFYIPFLIRIIFCMRARRIDIVHTFQLQSDIFGVFASWIARVPVKISSFEAQLVSPLVYGSNPVKVLLYTVMNRLIRPLFTFNVFISNHSKSTCGAQYNIPEKKQRLNYLGIEPEWFSNPPEIRTNPNPFCIGFVGRIDSEKGCEVFVDAVHLLTSKQIRARYKIIGHGALYDSILKRIHSLQLENSIELTGWQSDVRKAISDLDIVVVPSREEALSFVAIEALSQKRLVIASRVGGLPEVIIDKRTGLLAESNTPQSFADQLQFAVENWKDVSRLAAEGYRYAKGKFAISAEIEGFEKLYRECFSK